MPPSPPALALVLEAIRQGGPITVAKFMEIALYAQDVGYYARADRRSGRGGDFYTSVDAGPLFGRLLARLVEQLWEVLHRPASFDIIECGAGNGRLTRDVLDALRVTKPACYESTRVTLVERGAAARAAQSRTLHDHRDRTSSTDAWPPHQARGLLFANELLDAMPVHRVRSTPHGLEELFVDQAGGRLVLVPGRLSTPRLERYFVDVGCRPDAGGTADISLAALDWCEDAARALAAGLLLVVDYGMDGSRLYGGSGSGSLRTFSHHLVDQPEPRRAGTTSRPAEPTTEPWLMEPGNRDITAHVDFTAVEHALRSPGLSRLARVSQSRFLRALGVSDLLAASAGSSLLAIRERMAATTLLSPEGLGASHRVLLMSRSVAPLPFAFEVPSPE